MASETPGRDEAAPRRTAEKRLHGMTLSEVRALRGEPTPEDIAWAEKAIADYRSRQGAQG